MLNEMERPENYRPTNNYVPAKQLVYDCGGFLKHDAWGIYDLWLGGKHIRFRFRDGWCPLETLYTPPEQREIREDAIFTLVALFDRDDVKHIA